MASFALSLTQKCPCFPSEVSLTGPLTILVLKDLLSEEVMALANTMKLARFANGPLARLGEN